MGGKHDIIIMVIVGIIICFQLILFYKNLNRILAFKKIISKNSNINLIELSIDEDLASSIDVDTILDNKDDFDLNATNSESNLDENEDKNIYDQAEQIDLINQSDIEDIYDEDNDVNDEDDELVLFNKEDL